MLLITCLTEDNTNGHLVSKYRNAYDISAYLPLYIHAYI